MLRGCDAEQPFRTQVKVTGTIPLPYALRVSAVFQSMPGALETRTANNDGDVVINYIVNRAVIPSLTLAQVTTRLNTPGTDFLDRNNQLDISLTRDFKVGRIVLKPAARSLQRLQRLAGKTGSRRQVGQAHRADHRFGLVGRLRRRHRVNRGPISEGGRAATTPVKTSSRSSKAGRKTLTARSTWCSGT